jgi:hypothetical protein
VTSEHAATQAAELPHLNRVPATVLDIGLNQPITAARRIAEIDPYLNVRVLDSGVTGGTMGEFLAGLDTVVEHGDSLDLPPSSMRSSRRSIENPASTVF